MSKFKGEYLGGLRTKNIHTKSGSELLTDAPVDNHGKGEMYSPTDLVCTALATCMLTVMGIAANKEGIDIEGMTYEAEKIMRANPRKVSRIIIHFQMPTGKKLSDNEINLLKEKALGCPVALSLSENIEQDIHFQF